MSDKFDIKNIDAAKALSDRLRHVQCVIATFHPKDTAARVQIIPCVGSGLETLVIPFGDTLHILRKEEQRLQTSLYNIQVSSPSDAVCPWEQKLNAVRRAKDFLATIARNGSSSTKEVGLYLKVIGETQSRPLSEDEVSAHENIRALFEKCHLTPDDEDALRLYVQNGNQVP